MEVGGNLKAPPPSAASAMKPQQQQDRSSKLAASVSNSSSGSGSGSEDEQSLRRASLSKTTLHTAQRAPSSASIKLATKHKVAPIVPVDSDDESLPDDGIHRVTWNAFLRFNVPPEKKKKKKEQPTAKGGESSVAVGKSLKRKREEPGPNQNDNNNSTSQERDQKNKAPKKIKMTWKGRFEQLREYFEKHGTTRVPQVYKENQRFSTWVKEQRKKYTKRIRGENLEALSDARFALLQSLGFEAQERKGKQQQSHQQQQQQHRKLDPTFKKRLDQLHAFKEVFNHMKVPKHYEIVPGLHMWVKNVHAHPELLADEEREALQDIGFQWSHNKQVGSKALQQNNKVDDNDQQKKKALNATWVKRIKQLKEYHQEFGDFSIPISYEKDPSLGAWVKSQRYRFTERKRGKKSSLADHKFEALEKIGFDAHSGRPKENTVEVHPEQSKEQSLNAAWAKRLEQLKSYKEEHGNFRVPKSYEKDPSLCSWVQNQRVRFTQRKRGHTGILADHKFQALEALGLDVCAREKPVQSEFSTRLAELKAFKKEHGHTRVPKGCAVPGLRIWVLEVRHQYKEKERGNPSELCDDHIDALNGIGFAWSKKKTDNTQRGNKATSTGNRETATHVPGNSNLTEEEIPCKSDSIDHDASLKKKGSGSKWQNNFEKLKSFQVSHGHCKLNSKVRKEDPSFAAWVVTQRAKLKQKARGENVLAEEKYKALKNLGLEPSATHGMSEAGFERKFALLECFKREFGHTRVPDDSPLPGLRKWVVHIRQAYRKKHNGEDSDLTQDQIDMLDDVDFEWNVSEKEDALVTSEWAKRLKQLELYKSKHGTVVVPRSYSADQPFADWASHQQDLYARAVRGDKVALSEKQFRALEKLGFGGCFAATDKSLVGPTGTKNNDVPFAQRLGQLTAYRSKYGHANVPPDYREAPGLRKWLDQMRHQYVNDRRAISEEKLALLASLKFDWLKGPSPDHNGAMAGKNDRPISPTWLNHLKELVEYEATHGDTRIPKRYKTNQQFADWVYAQRNHFSKRCTGDEAALSDQRFLALKKLGFEAARIDEPSPVFQQRITELKDFYGIFGHTKVHKTYNAAPGLKKWLASLRIKYKLWEEGDPTAISVRELEILDGLEFDWLGRKGKFASKKNDDSPSKYAEDATPRDTSWTGRLKQLEDFKAARGHIKIPIVYEPDQSFSNWVRTQKRLYTQRVRGLTDALTDDRFDALKRLGFEASAKKLT